MDRCALFVDAGYALGEGAAAVHGTRNRDSVSWDYAGLLKLLSSLSRDRTGLPLLRCYWYDVAGAGSRVAEQDALADLPGVKLRLSKARPSRKEGVEAEIRKDLTALARNRSVSDVIVVSAEEDLAPVIAEVQEFGVRALLLHIGTDGSWASLRVLRQECDEVIEISPSHLRPYVDLIAGAEPQLAAVGYRELPAAAAQVSGPHPVPEAAGAHLFDSPGPAGYERAPQLATVGGQFQDPRNVLQGADARSASVYEGQPVQSQPVQPQRALTYQQSDAGGPGLTAAADAGFGQAAFVGADGAHSVNGHGDAGQVHDFSPASGGHADVPVLGMPANGVLSNGMLANGLPGPGLTTHGLPGGLPPGQPAAPVMQPGMGQGGAAGQHLGGQLLPGQPPPGQQTQAVPQAQQPGPAQSQSASVLPQPPAAGPGPGQHSARELGGQQNGLVSFDAQRSQLAQRQLPAGNGLPYGQDRGAAYPGQLQASSQFGGPVTQQPYGPGPYGAPAPSAPPPMQLPVGEAVQSAHAEGFGFGEAVARDAPALWLEAVLARKPRMPSDLEARLLQGSALPIDSLLHDEVRHALRRGFWDALERSRH